MYWDIKPIALYSYLFLIYFMPYWFFYGANIWKLDIFTKPFTNFPKRNRSIYRIGLRIETLMPIFARSLESANSSILASCDLFKEVVGEKNQGFMIIRFSNPSDLIGCGGDN